MEFRHFIPIFLVIALSAGILLVAFGYSIGYNYAGFAWSSDNQGTSIRPLTLKQNVTCPQGLLTIYATSVGDEIANANISVVLVSPFVGEVSGQLSNYTGGVQVNLTRSGNYEVDGSLAGYQRPETLKFYFDYAACKQVADSNLLSLSSNNASTSNNSTNLNTSNIMVANQTNVSVNKSINNTADNSSVISPVVSDTYVPAVILSDAKLAATAQDLINNAQKEIEIAKKNGSDVSDANVKLSLSKIALVSQYYEKSISLANEAIALAKSAKITPGVKVDGGSQVPTQVTQTDFTGAIALSAVLVFIAIAFVSYYILIKNKPKVKSDSVASEELVASKETSKKIDLNKGNSQKNPVSVIAQVKKIKTKKARRSKSKRASVEVVNPELA
ncbi:MAG: hypothetical protein AABX38_02375 [Candidatus Micrarchaeota archaeon]